jgi:lipoprotein-anchoring transpeptidase ErfK/SrfK
VRLKKIVLGLSAVAAAAVLAACSSGSHASGGSPSLAANAGTPTTSTAATSTTTVAPTTTTTTTQPTTTTRPPVTTTKPKPTVPADETAAEVPCSITTGACVSLSQHKAWLLNAGQIVYGPVHAEGGRTGWSTPVGTFAVEYKAEHYVSKEFNAPMPFAVFFLPGIALHEGSASTPSHGCVHLSASAAQTFFHDMSSGEAVQIVH